MIKTSSQKQKELNNKSANQSTNFCDAEIFKFANYNYELYNVDILNFGLKETWNKILNFSLNNNAKTNDYLNVDNFAKLYEEGLAIQDKQSKKDSGQYYTPDDVALLLASWFEKLKGENICDVGCGTGKLILTYLNLIGKEKARKLILEKKLFLFEIDEVALSICKTIILIKYGRDLEKFINVFEGDFLNKNLHLPKNCKVICNPPYVSYTAILDNWEKTEVTLNSKQHYAMFMEKILLQSEASVIISPYSFISGDKFHSLRFLMNNYNGFIVSFDNVPGNIFKGKKHGIFNSNRTNSVRAAITVVENKGNCKGFKLTPLIRFKSDERAQILNMDVLEQYIYNELQIITEKNSKYFKCDKRLGDIWHLWQQKSTNRLKDYIKDNGENILAVSNTCRYYTTASHKLLNRKGQIILNIEDKDVYYYIYCLLNSSFAYWFWRLYDGGITYSKSLLLELPLFFDLLTKEDKQFCKETALEMISNSSKYLKTKKNVGIQENIRFPKKYRDVINKKFLQIIGSEENESIFDIIHSNCVM